MKVERRIDLSVPEFIEKYLALNRPVIVTDAISRWPLRDAWSAENISKQFGGELTQIYGNLFELEDVTTLQTYFDQYWNKPDLDLVSVPYVRWYAKLKSVEFAWADRVFEAMSGFWEAPYFLPPSDYLLPCHKPGATLSPVHDAFPAKGIFISARGAQTSLHEDPWSSDAILCQMQGRKHFTLRPAESMNTKLDHVDTEGASKPRIEAIAATPNDPAYDDVLSPGEVLYIPAGWFHHVETLSDSISITWNFVHRTNWMRFFHYLAHAQITASDREVLQYFSSDERGG